MVAARSARFCTIAHITKSHGIKGEVVCTPAADLPFVVVEGLNVVILPPQLEFSRFQTVKSVKPFGEGYLVSLSDITSIDHAQLVCPGSLLACPQDLPEEFFQAQEEDAERTSLIGMHVSDITRGDLGCIEEIIVSPAHDVWVVRGSTYGEVLIPAVNEMVLGVNDNNVIEVDLVEGLIS